MNTTARMERVGIAVRGVRNQGQRGYDSCAIPVWYRFVPVYSGDFFAGTHGAKSGAIGIKGRKQGRLGGVSGWFAAKYKMHLKELPVSTHLNAFARFTEGVGGGRFVCRAFFALWRTEF